MNMITALHTARRCLPLVALLALPPAALAGPLSPGLNSQVQQLAVLTLRNSDDKQISQSQAAAIARNRYGGKVMSVSRTGGDRPAYKVKLLLDNGRVKVVYIDANTGRILGR